MWLWYVGAVAAEAEVVVAGVATGKAVVSATLDVATEKLCPGQVHPPAAA